MVSMPVTRQYCSSTPFITAISCWSPYCTITFSSMVSENARTSGSACSRRSLAVSAVKVFPETTVTFKSVSKALYNFLVSSSKPLKTDITITKATVPTQTPTTDTAEITLTALCDFFANKYRRATRKGKENISIFVT